MIVYVSGPMRGIDDYNTPAFAEAARWLREEKEFTVLNPAEHSFVDRRDCLRFDIQCLLLANAVVVLPDWDISPGARFEVSQAWVLGLPVWKLVRVEGTTHRGSPNFILEDLEQTAVTIPRENQYLNKIPLLGLSGYAQVGKDTVADILVAEHGWKRVALADPLKLLAQAIDWDGQKDDYGRRLLQNLGVGVREHLHSDLWVHLAENAIDSSERPVVITDVRFLNEVQMIRRRGGKIIRVERPGVGPVNDHVSEQLDSSNSDLIIDNDGTIDDLHKVVIRFLEQLEWL